MKRLIYLTIIVITLVTVVVVGKKKGWISSGYSIEVSTEKIQNRKIIETVSANGKIQPELEIKISPEVSGEIIELHIVEGDQVVKGDLLVKINPDIYLSAVNRAEAALNTTKANLANSKARFAQARAQLINSESTFKRQKALFKGEAISESEFENADASYQMALADVEAAKQTVVASEFNVKSAEASLSEMFDNLKRTTIFAPIDGTISMLNVEQGERVVGTAQMTGTELLRISNLNAMEVLVEVNENDIVRVHLSDEVEIDVDAYLDRKFKGVVTEIANSAKTQGFSVDQITNFEVKIRMLPESYKDLIKDSSKFNYPFRPGMTATVEISTETENNVLSIPIQSVTTRDDTTQVTVNGERKRKGNKPGKKEKEDEDNLGVIDSKIEKKTDEIFICAFVLDNGVARLRVIKTGIQDNNFIQVLSGLKPDDEIITAPYSAISKSLKNGTKVEKVEKEELFSSEEN